jgi:hypothetical protein
LVAIAGPKYMPLGFRNTPLAPLLPVELATARCPPPDRTLSEGFVVRPTALGLASPAMQLGDTREQTLAIWKGLPPLYWMLAAPQLKPGARVLAEHPSAQGDDGRPLPLVVLQYVGAGQVLLHATDETWRWRRGVGDVFFARYWIQTLRALARSKLAADSAAELSTDRAEYALGEPVALRVRFADERLAPPEDDGVTVVLEHAGHRTLRVRLQRTAGERGIFEALHDNASAGRYHAWVAIPALEGRAPAADFSVVAPPDEMEQTRMDAAELQRAAEQTNGHFYTFATAGSLVDDLPAVRPVTIESLPPTPLWNQWPLFVLLVVLLSLEWILRKYVGLV